MAHHRRINAAYIGLAHWNRSPPSYTLHREGCALSEPGNVDGRASLARLPGLGIAAATAALFAATVVVDLVASGRTRPFGYLASDAYYYLNIARNVIHHGRFAFDGEHSTNGFHPLWQLFAVPVVLIVEAAGGSGHHLATAMVVVNGVLVAASIFVLGLALLDAIGSPTVLFPLVPVGAHAFLSLPIWLRTFGAAMHGPESAVEPLNGTLWRYVNGMESSLALLLFAIVFRLATRRPASRRTRHAALLGLSLALCTLARLDLVLITVPVALQTLLRRDRGERRSGYVTCVIFGAPILVYLLINLVAFGSIMPVSGGLKSSFPEVVRANLDKLLGCIIHLDQQPYSRLYRMEQIAFPMMAAAAYLVSTIRANEQPTRTLKAVAVGVITLGAYDLLYVDLPLHGHWYFPISTLFMSIASIQLLYRWCGLRRMERSPTMVVVAAACAGVASIAGFIKLHRYVKEGAAYADFYFVKAPQVRAHYGTTVPRFLENDDGIISFSTGYPAMAGMGLALDPVGAAAWTQGRIVPLAVSRGFNRATSLVYWHTGGLGPQTPSDALGGFLRGHLGIPEPARFHYTLEFRAGNFAIILVEPAPPRPVGPPLVRPRP